MVPEGAVPLEPVGGVLERRGDQTAAALAADQLSFDQPGTLEHAEVLGHAGQGHVERGGERHGRGRTVLQVRQDLPPRLVREGAEDVVKVCRWMCRHIVLDRLSQSP